MTLEARLESYKVTEPEAEPEQVLEQLETTWCQVHMASSSSLQNRCYYALNWHEDTACSLVPALVSCLG